MSFSIAAWYQSIDTGAALTAINALSDQHLTTSGTDVLVPTKTNKLVGTYALGADLTQAQFSTPSLRSKVLLDFETIETGATPTNGNLAVNNMFSTPVQLVSGEGARMYVINDGVAASNVYGAAWFGDGSREIPEGEIFTVKLTGSTTLTANAWTLVPLTASQQLPAGRYAIVGARFRSANAILGRLVISGESSRPGCVAENVATDLDGSSFGKDVALFRRGGCGVWGEFEHTYLPQAEFLASAADTAETVFLDLIQIRSGAATP